MVLYTFKIKDNKLAADEKDPRRQSSEPLVAEYFDAVLNRVEPKEIAERVK